MQELNKNLLQYLNSFVDYQVVESIVMVMADGPILLLPVFLLFGWFYFAYKKDDESKKNLLHIFYATVIGIIISLIIQQFVNIDRPETAIEGTERLILDHIPDASFPSDHATVSFAFLAGLFLFGFKRLAYAYLPLCIIMNLSRVIAGVHWPFDIIAGMFVGISSAYIIAKLQAQKYMKLLNEFVLKIAGFFKL